MKGLTGKSTIGKREFEPTNAKFEIPEENQSFLNSKFSVKQH